MMRRDSSVRTGLAYPNAAVILLLRLAAAGPPPLITRPAASAARPGPARSALSSESPLPFPRPLVGSLWVPASRRCVLQAGAARLPRPRVAGVKSGRRAHCGECS